MALAGVGSAWRRTGGLARGLAGLAARRSGETRVLAFPGQGSQVVGMGADILQAFPEAAEVCREADEALERSLCSDLMLNGPAEELDRTENAQPVLLAYSLAVLRVLQERGGLDLGAVDYAMGHSLGEFTALVAAGVLSLADAVRIVNARGVAMQEACDRFYEGTVDTEHTFAMVALMPVMSTQASCACMEAVEECALTVPDPFNVCQVANVNSPKQVVISGTKAVVDRACAIAKAKFKARRAIPLRVSAPFHSPVMAPAAHALEAALDRAAWREPAFPVVSNVTGRPVHSADELRRLALLQLTSAVQWTESVQTVLSASAAASANPSTTFIEPGTSVLAPLITATAAHVEAPNVVAHSFDSCDKLRNL